MINAVGKRLRETDPLRWEGVPITFKTSWMINGDPDIRTCCHVHDALEREFNVDVDDKRILLSSVSDCFDHIMSCHHAI